MTFKTNADTSFINLSIHNLSESIQWRRHFVFHPDCKELIWMKLMFRWGSAPGFFSTFQLARQEIQHHNINGTNSRETSSCIFLVMWWRQWLEVLLINISTFSSLIRKFVLKMRLERYVIEGRYRINSFLGELLF